MEYTLINVLLLIPICLMVVSIGLTTIWLERTATKEVREWKVKNALHNHELVDATRVNILFANILLIVLMINNGLDFLWTFILGYLLLSVGASLAKDLYTASGRL